MNPEAYGGDKSTPTAGNETPNLVEIEQNELSSVVEVQNTSHHKAIVRARDEFYLKFKKRFLASVEAIMQKFDSERGDEHRFNAYWAGNLKEITVKHI
jgi:hypothetical protein